MNTVFARVTFYQFFGIGVNLPKNNKEYKSMLLDFLLQSDIHIYKNVKFTHHVRTLAHALIQIYSGANNINKGANVKLFYTPRVDEVNLRGTNI